MRLPPTIETARLVVAPDIMRGLVRDFQARGYTTETAVAGHDWAYRTLGRITASLIDPNNHASRLVAERFGAKPDGAMTLRGHQVEIDSHPAPELSRTAN